MRNKYLLAVAVCIFIYWLAPAWSIYKFTCDEKGKVHCRCNVITGKIEELGAYHRPTFWSQISGNGTYWHEVGNPRG